MSQPDKRYKIAVVEDNKMNAELLEAFLVSKGYQVFMFDKGMDFLAVLPESDFDLIILDVMLGEINGYEICRRIKSSSFTRLIPVILLTSLDSLEHKQEGYGAGADEYLAMPFNWSEFNLKIASLLQLKEVHDELEAVDNVLSALVKIVEAKDIYTAGHSERVAAIAAALARKAALSEDEVETIRRAGKLHDLGKIYVDFAVLNKRGSLNGVEFAMVKKHPEVGAEILQPLNRAQNILPLVRGHHEKLDGSGYPDGLKGEEISIPVRILTVADIYDALTSHRPYRGALRPEQALEILAAEVKARHLDGEMVSLLDTIVRDEESGLEKWIG